MGARYLDLLYPGKYDYIILDRVNNILHLHLRSMFLLEQGFLSILSGIGAIARTKNLIEEETFWLEVQKEKSVKKG